MARLPVMGEEDWGGVLNEFLLVAHDPDGKLKDVDIVASKYVKPPSGIPKTDLAPEVQSALAPSDEPSQGVLAPAPTGDADTDTTNLQAAIEQTKTLYG